MSDKEIGSIIGSTDAFRSYYPEKLDQRNIKLIRGTDTNSDTRRIAASESNDIPGLTGIVLSAYNNHQNLELRPDYIWIEILAQFSAYVNGRAEELRSKIVSHKGQKELIVQDVGSIATVDFGKLTRRMLDTIGDNIKDPSLREWF